MGYAPLVARVRVTRARKPTAGPGRPVKSDRMNSKDRMQAAKAAKMEAEAELKKAKADRYRKKTDTRQKSGGAGMHITFYDLAVGGKKVRVRRKKR